MSTLTPNYGLIVPEATDTVAQVRADYATNLGIIDNISGGGGGGGGNVYGAFVNTNRIIQAQTTFRSSMSYTATEDCFVMFYIKLGVGGSRIQIDGADVAVFYDDRTVGDTQGFYVRKGQIISATTTHPNYDSYYVVYGLIQGTENIFTPIIYSDNERMIGIWRDNKPLYQKTLTFVGNINANTTNNFANVSALNIDTFVSGLGNGYESGWGWEQLPANLTRIRYNPSSGYIELVTGAIAISGTTYITIQYTKTTDTAGSGNWNTDGIPMVHYSTSEQVVGTWIDGKPLYSKTINFGSIPSNTTKEVDHNISALKMTVGFEGTMMSGSTCETLPSGENSYFRLQTTSSKLKVITGASWSGWDTSYITIKYTKTTD